MAIMKGTHLETATTLFDSTVTTSTETEKSTSIESHIQSHNHLTLPVVPLPGKTVTDLLSLSGTIVYTDAAWSPGPEGCPTGAGIGIFIQFAGDRQCSQLSISAVSPPATSVIQAEAFSMMLASKIVELLHIQHVTFLTDSATLAAAIAARSPILAPGHWTIRPQLAIITASSAFDTSRIYHVNRSYNFRAHHQARLALGLKRSSSFKCLGVTSQK